MTTRIRRAAVRAARPSKRSVALRRWFEPSVAARSAGAARRAAAMQPFVRDPKIPIDEEYTKKIKEYTTEPFFTRRSSTTCRRRRPCRRRRRCSATSPARRASCRTRRRSTTTCACSRRRRPRVKVFSIGKTEEGREMIAVAVASRSAHGEARREPRASSPSSPIRARST